MSSKQSGFTLIELVVVIVIIGILAAAALPRFVDLQGEARESAAQGLAGSLSGAAAMVHGKWAANGLAGGDTVDVGGDTVTTSSNGYPQFTETELLKVLQQDPAQSGNWEWAGNGGAGTNSSAVAWQTTSGSPTWQVVYNSNNGAAYAKSQ